MSTHNKTMTRFGGALLGAALALAAGLAHADNRSPIGVWKTIDDETGQAKSLVEISEHHGMLSGRVVKLFNPSEPNPVCKNCSGDKKDQPITGMEILWGLKKNGDEWAGGKVLDPQKGKVYNAKVSLAENGRKLNLRGFVGVAALGRTQTWIRETDPASATDAPNAP